MKLLFLKAKKLDLPAIEFSSKKAVGVAGSIQYEELIKSTYEQLKEQGTKAFYVGPTLGCNTDTANEFIDEIEEFLFIADGDFHPTALLKYKKPITVINLQTGKKRVFSTEECEAFEKRKKGLLLKFLHAEKVGILISTKRGQFNPKDGDRIKQAFPSKKFYKFISDNINVPGLEDFTNLDIFVNTACPRIESKNIINHSDIPKELWEVKEQKLALKN